MLSLMIITHQNNYRVRLTFKTRQVAGMHRMMLLSELPWATVKLLCPNPSAYTPCAGCTHSEAHHYLFPPCHFRHPQPYAASVGFQDLYSLLTSTERRVLDLATTEVITQYHSLLWAGLAGCLRRDCILITGKIFPAQASVLWWESPFQLLVQDYNHFAISAIRPIHTRP